MGSTRPNPSRQAIIREATRLFKQKGYRGTSLEDVAKVFSVSRPALYHYFKSKRDILFAIYQEVSKALGTGAEQILALDMPPAEKFRRIVEHHIRTILTYASAMAVYYDEAYELTRQQRMQIRRRRRTYTEALVGLYSDAVETGDFTGDIPPKLAVYIIIGACNWAYKWFDVDGPVSVETMAAYVQRLLETGYMGEALSQSLREAPTREAETNRPPIRGGSHAMPRAFGCTDAEA